MSDFMTTKTTFHRPTQLLESDTVVSVSTAHVTPEDGTRLNKDVFPALMHDDSSALVYVGNDLQVDDPLWAAWSPAFKRLVYLARSLGAKYMLLDGDAPEYDFLETFDW